MCERQVKVLKQLVSLLATTSGRDKTCRLVYYAAKFIAANIRQQIQKGSISNESYDLMAGRIERLGANMSLTRKVLRFGRPLGLSITLVKLIEDYLKSLQNKTDDIKKTPIYLGSQICSTLSLILYFLLDHVLYFSRVNLMDKRPKLESISDYYSNFFWLLDALFSILNNCLEIKHLFSKMQIEHLSSDESKSGKIKAIQENIDQIIIDFFRNLFDIPIALGFMYPKLVSPSTIGFFGIITSYIGCYQNFK